MEMAMVLKTFPISWPGTGRYCWVSEGVFFCRKEGGRGGQPRTRATPIRAWANRVYADLKRDRRLRHPHLAADLLQGVQPGGGRRQRTAASGRIPAEEVNNWC